MISKGIIYITLLITALMIELTTNCIRHILGGIVDLKSLLCLQQTNTCIFSSPKNQLINETCSLSLLPCVVVTDFHTLLLDPCFSLKSVAGETRLAMAAAAASKIRCSSSLEVDTDATSATSTTKPRRMRF